MKRFQYWGLALGIVLLILLDSVGIPLFLNYMGW